MTFRTITIVILILPRIQGHSHSGNRNRSHNPVSNNSHGSKRGSSNGSRDRGSNRPNDGLSPIREGNHQKMSCGSRWFSRMSNETLAGKHSQGSRTRSGVQPCQEEHRRRGPVVRAPAGRNSDRILLGSQHRDPRSLLPRHLGSEPRPRPRPLHGTSLRRSVQRPIGTEPVCQTFRSPT